MKTTVESKGIAPTCYKCKKTFNEYGAILFSPPDDNDMVKKYHVCKECFEEIKK